MKIHKKDMLTILQRIANQYDLRAKITFQSMDVGRVFRNNYYARIDEIIKHILLKRVYILNKEYPEHLTNYILEIHNKTIKELLSYYHSEAQDFRGNHESLNALFNKTETIKNDKKLVIQVNFISSITFPNISDKSLSNYPHDIDEKDPLWEFNMKDIDKSKIKDYKFPSDDWSEYL